ncbi:MAG: exodeoxyribonuclease VII large subunit [Chloroflexota bacterium]
MDISVSHLNQRLAVQLPARLPLGLVFVVGRVENVQLVTGRRLEALRSNGRSSRVQFDLVDKMHNVRCELSARTAAEVDLEEGDEVRASGHLVFDPYHADYFLLARDIDLVEEEQEEFVPEVVEATEQIGRTALTPILADIKKRSEAAKLAPTEDMPYWVKKMAPPEFQPEMLPEAEEEEETAVSPTNGYQSEPLDLDLDDGLIEFLSQAMDSEETVELTPSLLSEYPAASLEKIKQHIQPILTSDDLPVTSEQTLAIQKQQQHIDRLVMAFIVLIILLTIVMLVGAVLLL